MLYRTHTGDVKLRSVCLGIMGIEHLKMCDFWWTDTFDNKQKDITKSMKHLTSEMQYWPFREVLNFVTIQALTKTPRPCKMSLDSLSSCNKSPEQLKSQRFSSSQPKSSCIQTLQMWLLMHISSIHWRQDINADIHLQPPSQCPSFWDYCH